MKGKIFNAQEVQAIIAGTKTMFREVIKTQTKTNEPLNLAYTTPYRTWEWGNSGVYVEEPYEVGQKIFVKTADLKWKPAQHMKQEHSRLTLEVVNIKVERLDDITEEDCLKEGVSCHVGSEIADTGDYFDNEYWFGDLEEFKCNNCNTSGMDIGGCDECCHAQPLTNTFTNAYDPFIENWNNIHKKPEEKFEANPFVWVVDFKINK